MENLKKLGIVVFAGLLLLAFSCKRDPYTYAILETDQGRIKVMLYNSTPYHRDNFIKLAKSGYYDSLLFHRVIPGFMIQGGDPDSRHAKPGDVLGISEPDYRLVPEIGAPHLRGALAAAQKSNPQKLSSGSQFYIVVGSPVTAGMLDTLEQQKGIKYNPAQRQLYLQHGGAPWLDNDYTVFGEVVDGMEVVDAISKEQTDLRSRPLKDVRIQNVRIR